MVGDAIHISARGETRNTTTGLAEVIEHATSHDATSGARDLGTTIGALLCLTMAWMQMFGTGTSLGRGINSDAMRVAIDQTEIRDDIETTVERAILIRLVLITMGIHAQVVIAHVHGVGHRLNVNRNLNPRQRKAKLRRSLGPTQTERCFRRHWTGLPLQRPLQHRSNRQKRVQGQGRRPYIA